MSFDNNALSVGKGSRCRCKANMLEEKDWLSGLLKQDVGKPKFKDGPHKIDKDLASPGGVLCLLCKERFTKEQYCTDLKGYHVLKDDPTDCDKRVCSRCDLTFTRRHECEVIKECHEWAPIAAAGGAAGAGLHCRHCKIAPPAGRLDDLVAKIPPHVTDFYVPDRNKLNDKPGYVMINVSCEERRRALSPEGTLSFECPFCYKSYKKDGQPRARSKRVWHHHGIGEGSRVPHCVGPTGGGSQEVGQRLGFRYSFHLRKSGVVRHSPY